MELNYIEINKQSWNNRTDAHLKSDFYDVEGFILGKTSLNNIELNLLGDIKGKSILHLQCHFGQDTIQSGPEQYRIEHLGKMIPMVYTIVAEKNS